MSVRYINWGQKVREAWGDEYYQPDVVYEFSNGRKFNDTGENGGPYEQPEE